MEFNFQSAQSTNKQAQSHTLSLECEDNQVNQTSKRI